MKKLLNTLYVTSENSYLGLDGENVVVYEEKEEIGRLPLHNLEGIVSFGYRGVSPVSYTHLDVYKRQAAAFSMILESIQQHSRKK